MKKRILIVEDEEKLRRVIELQLTSAGFERDKAGTAEQGLKVVDRADLVLTDLRLPGMDGLDLLARIRQQNAVVPVIVMTAFGTIETAVGAMKAGATDFLLKPFSLDHLMTVVNKAMDLMGAFGYSRMGDLEKYWRDSKIMSLWMGGRGLAQLDIARWFFQAESY